MAKILSLFLFAIILSASPGAIAEEAKPAGPYSLQQCLAIAMQGNVDVLTARNNATTAKSRWVSARSDYFPQVSLQNNAFVWGSQGVLSTVTTGTAFTVSQNIFDGGLREASTQSARYSVRQNNAGLSRTLQTVTYNVSKGYYELLRARHLAEVAQASVTYNEGLLSQVQERARVGDAAKVDVLPIEAQLAGSKVSLLSAKNTVRTSAIQLQSIIGLSSEAGFEVQEAGDSTNAAIGAMEIYMATALKSRPDMTQYKAATGAARASVRSSRISLYPRPTISGQYQRQVSGGFTTSGTQVVGGLVFDIFNGGAKRAAYREALATQANAQLQEQQTVKDVRSGVEEAYLNLTNASQRVEASTLSLESADKNYQAQKERYSQGLGTTLDLLNAEVQLVTAQSDQVQARYDYYIAIAQMDYAIGK